MKIKSSIYLKMCFLEINYFIFFEWFVSKNTPGCQPSNFFQNNLDWICVIWVGFKRLLVIAQHNIFPTRDNSLNGIKTLVFDLIYWVNYHWITRWVSYLGLIQITTISMLFRNYWTSNACIDIVSDNLFI